MHSILHPALCCLLQSTQTQLDPDELSPTKQNATFSADLLQRHGVTVLQNSIRPKSCIFAVQTLSPNTRYNSGYRNWRQLSPPAIEWPGFPLAVMVSTSKDGQLPAITPGPGPVRETWPLTKIKKSSTACLPCKKAKKKVSHLPRLETTIPRHQSSIIALPPDNFPTLGPAN